MKFNLNTILIADLEGSNCAMTAGPLTKNSTSQSETEKQKVKRAPGRYVTLLLTY